jgi:hypothetical protein
MSAVLSALLATPLHRGMRCATCCKWHPDPHDDQVGACDEHDDDTMFMQGCVYWSPRAGCGLDYMGIPLASPLADGEGVDV